MSEWKKCKLGDVVELVGGGTPKTTILEYWNGDIPWLSVTDFSIGNKYVYNTEKTITRKGLENSSTKLLNEGDIIISARGTVGALAVLRKKMAFNQTSYGIKSIPDISYCDYLYYLIKDSISNLQQIAYGGVFDTITRETFNQIEILLPPLPEQRAIAAVLSSLDDKIDLLHRQNKTLEAMAEALCRKMFIEEANPLWVEKGLDEIATFLNGLPCQKYPPDTSTESLPVIKIKELRTGITDDSDLATSEVPPEYIIDDGDILFSWSGSLEIVIWSSGKGVLNQHLFKVTSNDYPKWFYYYWIKHHLAEFKDIAQDKATTMGHIQRHHLSAAKVLIPDEKLLVYLNAQIGSIFEKMIHNLKAIRELVRLRDMLLPKLMSGEVRVSI